MIEVSKNAIKYKDPDGNMQDAGVVLQVDKMIGLKEEQEKTISITENGTTEVIPDDGKTLAKVNVNVKVGGGSGVGSLTDSLIDGTITEIVSNVETVRELAFYKCVSLVSASFPMATKLHITAFSGCTNLKNVFFPLLEDTQATQAFLNCTSITEITDKSFPKLKTLWASLFEGCTGVKKVDLSKITICYQGVFRNCSSLDTVVFRTEGVINLRNSNAFQTTPIADGTGYIYVPSQYIESYKVATNWTTYATQFRALEDYTVDGTITGELDESKI